MGDPLRTPLCDRLGIEVPIVLAPMAGGPSTPELAAAVSAAGGLGCLALTGLTAAAADAQVRRALELAGGRPVAVNVQVPTPRAATTSAERLAPFLDELGAEPASSPGAPPDPPDALLEAALAAGATAISTALGDPGPYAAAAREGGVPLIAGVSTVDEARRAVEGGADILVAQGAEAGGHRMTWDVDSAPLPLVGLLALLPRVVDATGVPVLAAGGIADGRGVAAALALGAQGAWLGTRFLSAREAGTTAAQRALLAGLSETGTVVTEAVTGRPARWVDNVPTATMRTAPGHLGWPGQGAVVRPRLVALAAGDDPARAPLLAGQGGGTAPDGEPAAAIVAALAAEARAVLGRFAPTPERSKPQPR